MHRFCGLLAMLALLTPADTAANPRLVNGNFERLDLKGWTLSIDQMWYHDIYLEDGQLFTEILEADQLPFSVFDTFPFITPHVEAQNYYSPVYGTSYLEIPGNPASSAWYYSPSPGDYYSSLGDGTVSVSQQVTVDAGDVISGWVALYTSDYPPYDWDSAFVRISDAHAVYEPVRLTVRDAYGTDWDSPQDWQYWTPWTYWTWTAPKSGTYTISLNNRMDTQEQSVAVFDGVRIRPGHPRH